MNRPKTDIEKLHSLLDSLEESILRASEEEIIEETRVEGREPKAIADHVHELIAGKIKHHRQKELRAAQEGYRQSVVERPGRSTTVPESPSERRILLNSILTRRSDVPKEITVAWREGRYTSDADVASILEDLAELGFLEEDS